MADATKSDALRPLLAADIDKLRGIDFGVTVTAALVVATFDHQQAEIERLRDGDPSNAKSSSELDGVLRALRKLCKREGYYSVRIDAWRDDHVRFIFIKPDDSSDHVHASLSPTKVFPKRTPDAALRDRFGDWNGGAVFPPEIERLCTAGRAVVDHFIRTAEATPAAANLINALSRAIDAALLRAIDGDAGGEGSAVERMRG